MSDFTGTTQREGGNGGNWGKKMKKRHVMGLHSLHCQQRKVCAIIIHLPPFPFFSSWADFFFCFSIPARTGVALATQAHFDCDLIMTERLGESYLVNWLPDRFLAKVKKVALVLVRDRKRESPSGGGGARTNEWAKKDKMEWSSIKRPAVISFSPPSLLPLMS